MGGFELLGYAGAAVNIVTYSMRTMIPLRIMAIASNCIFIVYGSIGSVYPILVLHAVLLPLNAYRLREMLRLVANVRNAAQNDLQLDWLKPFMAKRRYAKGDVLFRQGDPAGEMFFTLSGRFLLRELSLELGVGEMVGELGLLAPENRRSQTLECVEAGEVLTIAYDQVRQLYFQNPAFGFYFLRLTTRRLFQNVARLEGELASLRGRPPALAHTATTTPASGSGFRQASETDAPARTSE
jgi:CRP/FNR family cyclic AMP-dependent transcriptional regulator